ncbi:MULTISPECIES: 2'-5' RNA ligase family protein [unclassified Pseudactinotalea]|uniref:2'-5' RNA ligase family protein n=1 Tax=unclassified Pseudactinotalea TaxID=2649176 RepID=UPI00128C7698|nr:MULTISPECIES: 2'-5' RNA ligase family protein [unclassified Pseudactinotalea]MPV51125.1 2'-5' RNA ligase family protein [Pseudactinotalea sp. HY160]QGH70317.1 2'-5' RNA ligase family protein [Pseudactinotalea sp. HY158]
MWIGVAIEIPDPYRAALTRARLDAGDPRAGLIPPHITLVPPTWIDPERLMDVVAHLARVAAARSPFIVRLAGTETFRPITPVVFVPLVRGGDDCTGLQAALNAGPLAAEQRFPYRPHVTIAHEIDDTSLDRAEAAMADFSAEFPVAAFELFEHGLDGVWRGIDRFTLTV